MSERKLKVGDPVLFYGKMLEVAALDDVDGTPRAKVVNAAGEKVRTDARAKINALRDKQVSLKGDEHDKIALQIAELDVAASQAIEHFGLRADLLTWWPGREVWVSEGRILSDDQIEQFKKITGSRPLPDAHRQALAVVEAMAKGG